MVSVVMGGDRWFSDSSNQFRVVWFLMDVVWCIGDYLFKEVVVD